MKDVFNEINNIINNSKQRWNKISELSDKLKLHLGGDVSQSERDCINLVLLLVDNFKPANDTLAQAGKIQDEINGMLSEMNSALSEVGNKFKK